MTQYKETSKEDWVRTVVYIVLFVGVIAAGGFFLTPIKPAGPIIWLLLIIGGLFLLVSWHARTFAYRCPKCQNEFEISTFTDFISPHSPVKGGGVKLLRCPNCHRWSWAKVIKKTRS